MLQRRRACPHWKLLAPMGGEGRGACGPPHYINAREIAWFLWIFAWPHRQTWTLAVTHRLLQPNFSPAQLQKSLGTRPRVKREHGGVKLAFRMAEQVVEEDKSRDHSSEPSQYGDLGADLPRNVEIEADFVNNAEFRSRGLEQNVTESLYESLLTQMNI